MKPNYTIEDEPIKKLIILQLYKDYEHIVYSYKLHLKKPLIYLESSSSFYGQWCPQRRAIVLSIELVQQYPWEIVLEILKHEMAHQYVTDLFQVEEKSHGAFFKKACHYLRVKTWAQKACLSLDKCLLTLSSEEATTKEDKSLRLVKKLLKLAESSNQNEALLALKKASDLAKKHQIQLDEIHKNQCFLTIHIKTGRKRIHAYETLIASLLSSHFGVTVVHSSLFNQKTCREEKVLEILGDSRRAKMADYIFAFLTKKLESLWRDQKENGKKGLKAKHSFFFGVLDGFRSELEKSDLSQKKLLREEGLLLKEQEEKLASYLKYEFPRIVHVKSRAYAGSSSEYSRGYSEGKKIQINEPIEKKALLKIGP